jgi:uncharacterized protein
MQVVVIDTNVYVSALVFGGKPALILQLGAAGAFQLVVSETIRAEVEEILLRKFGWDATHFAQVATRVWGDARHVAPTQRVKANAQVILTGDGDLLSLHPYREIAILTPKQFLDAAQRRGPVR